MKPCAYGIRRWRTAYLIFTNVKPMNLFINIVVKLLFIPFSRVIYCKNFKYVFTDLHANKKNLWKLRRIKTKVQIAHIGKITKASKDMLIVELLKRVPQ